PSDEIGEALDHKGTVEGALELKEDRTAALTDDGTDLWRYDGRIHDGYDKDALGWVVIAAAGGLFQFDGPHHVGLGTGWSAGVNVRRLGNQRAGQPVERPGRRLGAVNIIPDDGIRGRTPGQSDGAI